MNKKSTTLLIAALLLGLGLGVLLTRQASPQQVTAAPAHDHAEGDHDEEGHAETADAEEGHEEEGAIT
ncbi:MAG: efflux RND transporter periplasmic adaptor subunit, partial [Pseudomonas sp.]